MACYTAMGLRQRILTLPVMVAFVLSLIWRQVGSVSEAVRVLKRQGMLWTEAKPVSQQAVSERLRTFPAELFYRVLMDILPEMHQRWQERQRPLSKAIAWALERFPEVWVLDGSTLDALLRAGEGPVLAGRIAALVSAALLLPRQIWYEEDSHAHYQTFWERAVESLNQGVLLLSDLGFTNHDWFDRLSLSQIWFVTRAKSNAVYQVDYHQGKVSDPVQFLADEADLLGIIKRKRRPKLPLTDGANP
jgi:hypothetical protein